jgi:hypothetical protein
MAQYLFNIISWFNGKVYKISLILINFCSLQVILMGKIK